MIKTNFRVGDRVTITKSFNAEEVKQFAGMSVDNNPLHLDEAYARTTPFGKPIVHGMLVGSLFSGLLAEKLPGKGTIYLGQQLKFLKPVFIGAPVTASVEITHIRQDKPILTLKTVAVDAAGEAVIEGEAVVKYPH